LFEPDRHATADKAEKDRSEKGRKTGRRDPAMEAASSFILERAGD
jgi:hypothetical protein